MRYRSITIVLLIVFTLSPVFADAKAFDVENGLKYLTQSISSGISSVLSLFKGLPAVPASQTAQVISAVTPIPAEAVVQVPEELKPILAKPPILSSLNVISSSEANLKKIVEDLESVLNNFRIRATRQNDSIVDRTSTVATAAISESVLDASTLNLSGALTLAGATTTASRGFNISAGCFAVNGICLTSSAGFDTGTSNSWLGAQTFLASTTLQNFTATNSTTTNATTTNLSSSLVTVANGSSAAPSISFSARPGDGMYNIGASLGWSVGGAVKLQLATDALIAQPGVRFDGANYTLVSGGVAAGNNFFLPGTNRIGIATNSVQRWEWDAGGHYIAATDNTYDIGALGATRPRNIFVGTGITTANLLATSSTTLQNFTFVNATGTNATTTNFFATTASSTNFFSSLLTVGSGALVIGSAGDVVAQNKSLTPSITWTSRTSAADNQWLQIVYGNGLFVAASVNGSGNRIMTSPDGINWTSRTSAANNSWRGLTYGNGLFVAVANSGTGDRVMTSSDGINWVTRTSAADSAWMAVTYGNGTFVATAQGSGINSDVMTSPDGITWTLRTATIDGDWRNLAYGNGIFVAMEFGSTAVMTSTNGITWTSRTSAVANQWRALTYGNGLFVAVADSGTGNRVQTSPDGIAWTSRTSAADNSWSGITYGGGLFVAVAASGTGNRVMTSPDGITWTTRASAGDNAWDDITYGNGTFVAVSTTAGTGNQVMTSGKTDVSAVQDNNIYQGTTAFTGFTGIGTTTPRWALQVSASGTPQLTLSDSMLFGSNHWSFRNAGGTFYLATSSPSTFATSTVAALSIGFQGGVSVGSPTGGDKGGGSINVAGDVFKNNTAYTNPDYVLEMWQTGRIVQFADNPGASTYTGVMTLPDVEAYAREHYQLPRIATAKGMFERGDMVLEKLEEIFIYLFDLNKRIIALENAATAVVSGLAQNITEWIGSKITVGTARVTTGLELIDQNNGSIYCVTIKNGEWDKKQGDCSSPIVAPPPSPSVESESSSPDAPIEPEVGTPTESVGAEPTPEPPPTE